MTYDEIRRDMALAYSASKVDMIFVFVQLISALNFYAQGSYVSSPDEYHKDTKFNAGRDSRFPNRVGKYGTTANEAIEFYKREVEKVSHPYYDFIAGFDAAYDLVINSKKIKHLKESARIAKAHLPEDKKYHYAIEKIVENLVKEIEKLTE